MRIRLVSHTTFPLQSIALAVKNMSGEMLFSPSDVSYVEAVSIFNELLKTNLKGALEFAHFNFQIEGVTRAFTHQLVRHRIGVSYAQESLRFVVKDRFEYLDETGDPLYVTAMREIQKSYDLMIAKGVPSEKARGILPTNILTKIGMSISYKTLFEMAGVRLCYQAQTEWKQFMNLIKKQLSHLEPDMASALKPVCFYTKRCEFKSRFDRGCPHEPEKKNLNS